MGYQERDYYREEGVDDPLGLRALSMTTKLIIITVIVYLADLFFGGGDAHNVTRALALEAGWWIRPWKFYSLLTYGFAHDWRTIHHILGNMIGLYVFGRLLEERWGPIGLLRYYLIAIVFCGLVWSARHFFLLGENLHPCVGASGGVVACIILFCLLNPRATLLVNFFIPMPAWLLGVIIVGINLLGIDIGPASGNQPKAIAYDAHLAGIAFALGVWALKINFGRNAWLDAPGQILKPLTNWFKRRPDLRVHREQSQDLDEDDQLEAEGDRILAKISSQGDASLTNKERRTLEQYSRMMRDRRG